MLLMFQPVVCDHKKILSIAERRSRRFMPPLHSRDLSRSERFVPAQLCSNWSSNPDFPAYRLAPAALGRFVHGLPAAAVFAANRNDAFLGRAGSARFCRQLYNDPGGGGFGWFGFFGFPSGSISPRPTCLRRSLRVRSIAFSSWRKRRSIVGTSPGSSRYWWASEKQCHLVYASCTGRNRCALQCRSMVPTKSSAST